MDVTEVEFWQIQVRNAKFKLEIAQSQNKKMADFLRINQDVTRQIQSLIENNRIGQAIDLMVSVNYNVTQETQSLHKSMATTKKHHNNLFDTTGQLTNKNGTYNDATTPEMGKFWTLMQSHSQMYSKQVFKDFAKSKSSNQK